MKIRTECIMPPIQMRDLDWLALIDGQEEDGPYGRGPTEVDALRDLAEQLAQRVAELEVKR